MSHAVPSRFQHPIDAPDPIAADYYRRFLGKNAPLPMREQVDHLAASLARGDVLADRWVEHSRTADIGSSHALLARVLDHGIDSVPDAPAELRALFAQVDTVPLWLDPQQLELGCRTFRRTGPFSGLVLSGFSLMGGYRSSAVAKSLMMTGKLQKSAGRRLVDTGRFVFAVTEPGGLARDAAGFKSALHVRMVHAMLRYKLARSPDWRASEWGLPINQADMLGTNLLFSMGFLIGCRELGLSFSQEEAESIVHLWRYIGYLLGVDESLLPATEHEAARAMYLVGSSQPPADADSLVLAQALHEVPLERAVTERQKRLAQMEMTVRSSVSRVLLGDRVADELGLPKSPVRHGIRSLRPLIAGMERVRRLTPYGNELAFQLGQRWLKSALDTLDRSSKHERSQPAGS